MRADEWMDGYKLSHNEVAFMQFGSKSFKVRDDCPSWSLSELTSESINQISVCSVLHSSVCLTKGQTPMTWLNWNTSPVTACKLELIHVGEFCLALNNA